MNTAEYDVDDGDFPVNESSSAAANRASMIGGPSKSYSSLLKVSAAKKRQDSQTDEATAKPIRKPRPKLDFNRLLKGNRGLGYLAVCTKKNLKLSGKPGGEASDLSQISVYLQEWAKLVFPKMPLVELLAKVEEICQSRLMKACVPQILSRLKEMGEDVNLQDLADVQGEIMTKIESEEAQKALESIGSGFDAQSQAAKTSNAAVADIDFNVDEILERYGNGRERMRDRERSESIDTDDDEEGSEEDEEEFSKEMDGFINDNSDNDNDNSDNNSNSDNESESNESEAQFSSSEEMEPEQPSLNKRKGITLNFSDESDTESQTIDQPVESKKRSIGIIMDSDDE